MNTKLLCCDACEELLKLKENCGNDYVVATSDYRFYKKIRQSRQRAVFLESNESIPYETVWDILEQINRIIDTCSGLEYIRLFHFSYDIESGFPMKTAWMILNLNMIHNIVKAYHIKEIYVFDKKDNWIINESLFLYAQSYNLDIHIFDGVHFAPKACLKTLKEMDMAQDGMIDSPILANERKKIASIKNKHKNKKKDAAYSAVVQQEEFGILHCCPQAYEKHVQWLLKRVEAIGGDVRVVCYYRTEDVEKFRKKGLKADCLEDYFLWEDFAAEYGKLQDERHDAMQKLKRQLHISYLGVDLTGFFYLKIRNYYYRELIDYYYIDTCAKNYYKYVKYKYIHIWGGTNYWETWVCYEHTKKNGTKLFCIYQGMFERYRCKLPYQDLIAAAFFPNERLKNTLYPDTNSNKCCIISDIMQIKQNKQNQNAAPVKEKKSVGIFPPCICNGFTSYFFYYHTFIPLIERLLDRGYKVIFKYHPRFKDCWEEDVRQTFADNENFIYFDNGVYIGEALAQCYIAVSNISSTVFDAANAQKAAFCIVDDQGYSYISQHENGFSIFRSIDALMEQIELAAEHEDIYQKIIIKQNQYMSELSGDGRELDMHGLVRSFLEQLEEKCV